MLADTTPPRQATTVLNDTTPPQKTVGEILGPEFKKNMADLAALFPKLNGPLQEQARQAHAHVQTLIKQGNYDQASSLVRHMRDVMSEVVNKGETVPPPTSSSLAPSVPSLAIPPLPMDSSGSPEMTQLKRTVEDLQMKVKDNAAISLIAKRVRDMELEQRYTALETQLREVRNAVSAKLDRISQLTDETEYLAKIQIKRRTLSKNPFCQHAPSGYCEFCVGKEINAEDENFLVTSHRPTTAGMPLAGGGVSAETLANRETIAKMQDTLKSYQGILKELLQERKQQLAQTSPKSRE